METAAPLGELLATIAIFSALVFFLSALNHYWDEETLYARISVRSEIIVQINTKSFLTAYPNCFDPDRKKLLGRAMDETSGNQESTEQIWVTLTELLTNLGCFALYLVTLSGVSPVLIGVSLVTCVLASLIRLWAVGKYRNNPEQGKFWNQLSYLKTCTESVEKAKDIRLFGLGDWISRLYDDVLRLQAAFVRRREQYLVFSAAFGVVMTLLQNGVAYIYLLKMVLDGGLTASEFLLYFTAVTGFTAWVSGILENCGTIYQQTQGIGAVLAYIEGDEPFRFEGGRPLPDTGHLELRLENVTFRYPGAERNLFENLNLTIHPGEKLAVVGLNGAGKTTLVKLLCGFYDPTEGRVTLNGIDIREFNRREYYGLLCAVYQDFSVLDVTIAENVAQRAGGIDEKRVWECLEMAGLADFVKTLPQGLHTHVGRDVYLDGVLFSGGQTQRLMLARALYKDAPFIILDEPTAALDPIAEADIYSKFDRIVDDKTAIYISHRLSSCKFCDEIAVFHGGRVIQQGTHDSLLSDESGKYYALWSAQAQYYTA